MQKYIQGFIDEFYEKSMKEMLRKIKDQPKQEQTEEEDNEDLRKAQQALKTWKSHMDNYFFNRFNPKKKQKVIKKNQPLVQVNKTQKVVISSIQQQIKEVGDIESKVLPSQNTNIKQNPQLEQRIKIRYSQNQQCNSSDESIDDNQKNKLSSITLGSTVANTSLLKQKQPSQNNLFGSNNAPSLFNNQPVQNPFSFNLFKSPDNQQKASSSNLFGSEYSNQSSFYNDKTNQSLDISQISNSSLFSKPKSLFGSPSNPIFGPSIKNSQKKNESLNTTSQNFPNSFSLFPNSSQNNSIGCGPLFGNFTKVKTTNPIIKQQQKVNLIDLIKKPNQKQQNLNSSPASVIQSSNDQNNDKDQEELENDQSVFVSVQDNSEDQQTDIDFTVLYQMNVGLFIVKLLTAQKISYYEETISQYYPSNYFHVGPRYDILNFFHSLQRKIQEKECTAHQINNSIVQVGKKVIDYMSFDRLTSMRQISNQYYSSNYFHVGPRRTMFGYLQRIISIAKGQ